MKRRRQRTPRFDFSLNPETRRGVFTVAVFVFAALLLLALFDLAGRLGEGLDGFMSMLFGWDKIVLPFFLLAIGTHGVIPDRYPLRVANYVGFTLFFLSLNPLVHLLTFSGVPASDEALLTAGGLLGETLAEPSAYFFGTVGAGILFAALVVISLLFIFNTSLRRILSVLRGTLRAAMRVGGVFAAPFGFFARLVRRPSAMEFSETPEPAGGMDDGLEEEVENTEPEGGSEPTLVPGSAERQQPPARPRRRLPKVEVPLELLTKRDQRPTSGDIDHNQAVIRRTLEHFGIPSEMGEVAVGPTVTQFTLKPGEGIRLSKVTALHNDLALALAAHPIRIEAPIPGKSLVGIEVPNQSVATVGIREMLESREWRERASNLTFAVGKDVSGKPAVSDLARMPHLLVAGATGSGKSVCLNTLLVSMLYANGPEELKLILVDPKRVELPIYNGIPHLIVPVITETEKTVNALKWALREMDRRFDVLSNFGARDLPSYNQRAEERMPNIVIVVDELADLMMTAMAEVEGAIVRLAQMSRAVGIHLVLATQRPSVDVITGLIKANIPARIAFAVASQTDSRTILDQMGAEKLLGRGDMLFVTAEMATPRRLQGAFVADDEIKRVVDFMKSKYEPADYDLSVFDRASSETRFTNGIPIDDESDPFLPDAKEEILRAGKASASLLQRRLKVGYARAARILDLLEQEGFIGPGDGAKPREILNVQFTRQMDQVPIPSNDPPIEAFDEEH
ncbi:DNA translocase FtsK 4TM domain-containing protein [Candidatus Uhrbacteria bacterium]|nr:DNA translocase FtsK 4TM domain-containing protein [Candidatus Uhrbacteria bacterium]